MRCHVHRIAPQGAARHRTASKNPNASSEAQRKDGTGIVAAGRGRLAGARRIAGARRGLLLFFGGVLTSNKTVSRRSAYHVTSIVLVITQQL